MIAAVGRDAQRKSDKRAAGRDLTFDAPADPARRRECLANVYQFHRTYFPIVFYQPFTDSRSQMVDAICAAAAQSGDQAIAGPRGDGKTRCALFTAFWLSLRGSIHFPLVISKSGKRAMDELKNLKWAIRESELFAEDFPEIGKSIAAMGGWASRARQMTAFGEPINMEWGVDCIVLPTIPTDLIRENVRKWPADMESCADGQIFSSLGIEGPIRGYSVRNRRPDLALIDDIDDRESAHSTLQTDNRIEIIDADVAGLGGPDRNVSRVMLCTLINRTCAAYVFTDPKQRPSFRGQRHRLISRMPDNPALGEQYVALRLGRDVENDPDGRDAHAWYVERQAEIEAGHVTTNPYRYNTLPLSDGKPAEVSSYQGYLNFVADKGMAAALTELQNDPPPDEAQSPFIITPHHVAQNCRSGQPRGTVPEDTITITMGADVKKAGCNWVAIAWNDKAVGSVIDNGFYEFTGTAGKPASACELLILDGLHEWWGTLTEGWKEERGNTWDADLCLIDSGWKENGWNQQPVALFCHALKWTVCYPLKGIPNWRPRAPSKTWAAGNNYGVDRSGGYPLVQINADHWKLRVHEGFLSEFGTPGSLALWDVPKDEWGRDAHEPQRDRQSFAYQVCAERWMPAYSNVNSGTRWGWVWTAGKPRPNHYLDAMAYAIAAREVRGLSVTPAPVKPTKKPKPAAAVVVPRQSEEERPYLVSNR